MFSIGDERSYYKLERLWGDAPHSRHSRGTCAVSYGRLANVYDFLMADVPYEKWLQFVISKQKQFQVEGQRVLDLACGTGNYLFA